MIREYILADGRFVRTETRETEGADSDAHTGRLRHKHEFPDYCKSLNLPAGIPRQLGGTRKSDRVLADTLILSVLP